MRSPDPGQALEPALDFLQHLWRLNHALERRSLQMERELGVTAQQRLMVRCIGRDPGLSASDLSLLLHLDPGTVSVGLRRLALKRLVFGHKDLSDRRRVLLSLTSRGRALDRPDARTVEHAVEVVLGKCGQRNVAHAKAVLGVLSDALAEGLPPYRPTGALSTEAARAGWGARRAGPP